LLALILLNLLLIYRDITILVHLITVFSAYGEKYVRRAVWWNSSWM